MSILNKTDKIKNLFIVNPGAGTKQAKRHLPGILDLFSENNGENIVYLTSKSGDGIEFVSHYAASADRIICIGGDGTLSEVINGIKYNGFDIPIGYIPTGTANDFSNSLNLSKNIMQAAKDIIDGRIISVDIGRFSAESTEPAKRERYFSYIASFGVFTKASYNTPQSAKNTFGHFAYIIEGIKELPDIRPKYIEIETDSKKIEGEYIFGAISNSTSVGGILSFSPNTVDMSDGLFEIMLIKPLNNAKAVSDCVYSLLTQNYNSEYILLFSTDKAVIYADSDMKWSLDGERENGCEMIKIQNLQRAIKIIVKS
ncbi:MAG: diacylglycerol kinase family lipid kinase [Oscillospiraceae bacterium]|nr:diacylglycerol kinase family lipid kinase [Oscillospiraceae bacterium]